MGRTVLLLLLFIMTDQVSAQTNVDSIVKRIVLRNIHFNPNLDSKMNGTILLRFQRSGDSVKVKTLYSSIINYNPALQRQINKWDLASVKMLPKKYKALIPLYVTQSNEHNLKLPPSTEHIKVVEERIKTANRKTIVLKPVEIILYPTVR